MPFDFSKLLNDPQLQYGLALIDSSRTYAPYTNAQQALQSWQTGQRAQQELAMKQQLQQAQIGEYQALAGQHTAEAEQLRRRNALILGIIAKNHPELLGGMQQQPQGQAPQEPQAQQNVPQGVNPFNGIPALGADNQNVGGAPQIGGGMQQVGMRQAQEAAPTPNRPLVNPEAEMYSIAGFPQLAEMYQNASKPMLAANGMAYFPSVNGSDVEIAPGSLKAMKQTEEMQQAVKGQYSSMEVPLSNGQKATLSPTEWRTYQLTNQLPQRYGGTTQQPASSGNNFGNLRPQGATTGFQNFASPEAGLAAIDQNLQAYGAKGINTISSIINRWAPSTENNTAAYIGDVSRRLGVEPNTPLDMNNPAIRHVLGSAIMLHEQGGIKGLQKSAGTTQPSPNTQGQAAPVVGMSRSPEEQAQATLFSESLAKKFDAMQESAAKAPQAIGNMKMIQAMMNKIGTNAAAPAKLQFFKLAQAAGFQVPETASMMEGTQALTRQYAMQLRNPANGGGMPGQMSNYEDRLLQSMTLNIDKLPEANNIIANAFIKQQQRTIDEAKVAAKYKADHKGQVDTGLYDTLMKYAEDHPIFSKADADKINGVSKAQPKFLGFEGQ